VEPSEIRFIRDSLKELSNRTSAVEQFVRGKKGAECPQCEATSFYLVSEGRTAPKGWGVVGKDTEVHRCAMCGHEETRQK